jgi:hypothetical protein
MKKNILFLTVFALVVLSFSFKTNKPVSVLKGSWKGENSVIMFSDSYFSLALFNIEQKKFLGTIGGKYTLSDGDITFNVEYSFPDKSIVGESETVPIELKDGKFSYNGSQGSMDFTKIMESDKTPLAALWQITARENKEGKMTEMPKSARKTIKLLTDTRFQWAAINTETGEFFGTGGGTYTLKDGKYTENIEFFSRDSSRVGATLSFDAAVKDNKWQHSGKSSTGNPVNEIWEKQD